MGPAASVDNDEFYSGFLCLFPNLLQLLMSGFSVKDVARVVEDVRRRQLERFMMGVNSQDRLSCVTIQRNNDAVSDNFIQSTL